MGAFKEMIVETLGEEGEWLSDLNLVECEDEINEDQLELLASRQSFQCNQATDFRSL